MNVDVFPEAYERREESKLRQKCNEISSRSDSRITSINSGHSSEPVKGAWLIGLLVGLFGGFGVCFLTCSITYCSNSNKPNITGEAVANGVLTWIIVGIISIITGIVIGKISRNKYVSNETRIAFRVKSEEKSAKEELSKVRGETNARILKYRKEFDQNVQELSTDFAVSKLAQEVIGWMTDGFCKTIDSANRSGHIEIVEVPFEFNVYKSRITCNLGTYDFKLKRCKNLTSNLEEAALSKALATAIQINIVMKYPKDISGTDVSIDISYVNDCANDCSMAVIKYIAPNGYFKAERGW